MLVGVNTPWTPQDRDAAASSVRSWSVAVGVAGVVAASALGVGLAQAATKTGAVQATDRAAGSTGQSGGVSDGVTGSGGTGAAAAPWQYDDRGGDGEAQGWREGDDDGRGVAPGLVAPGAVPPGAVSPGAGNGGGLPQFSGGGGVQVMPGPQVMSGGS